MGKQLQNQKLYTNKSIALPKRVNISIKKSDSSTTNISLVFLYPIMTVVGDSGSGKTYLCNFIDTIKKLNVGSDVIQSTVALSDVIVIQNVADMTAFTDSDIIEEVVIIDRFDRNLKQLSEDRAQRLIDKIKSFSNLYILMCRGRDTHGLNLRFQSRCELWTNFTTDSNNLKHTYIEVGKSNSFEVDNRDFMEQFNW